MEELHRKTIVPSLLCLLLCGTALSKFVSVVTDQRPTSQRTSDNDLSAIHNTHSTSTSTSEKPPAPNSSSPNGDKKANPKEIIVAVSTPPGSGVTAAAVKQDYEMNGTSMVLMLAMIGVAVGTACALGTVAVIFVIRRRATTNREVSRKVAQRTNMYVIRNENYDLNKTLSGIPSVTDMWKELHTES
ncbi:uncharacterized protein LOC121371510 [Gigantopelta aegis]|uniref:uncharacterized protein LOC121371510 n=1 Tax=Gigantopelta aegis TaxID=1735272 RepID=UPI001B8892D4|nr:uncharacterized protein LOC121371510 [Gigantopelta aegis]